MRDFHLPGRSPVFATNGMCATSHPLAARTAVDILERGGNAVDAAIAGALLLGICEPQMTGIGGDCFVLFNPAGSDDIQAFNGSGRAPTTASAEALRDIGHETVPIHSAHAVTVPGAIDAFCRLSDTHGKLGLDALLAPTIQYAEDGVPVAPRVANDWPTAGEKLQKHGITHYSNSGSPLRAGQIFRAPGQAEVLRRIAKDGRDAFYTGEVAEDMLAALTAAGGLHSAADFADILTESSTPVSGTYKDIELVEHPPNGQGTTAILLLNILKHYDIASMDPLGSQRAHIEAEATKSGTFRRGRRSCWWRAGSSPPACRSRFGDDRAGRVSVLFPKIPSIRTMPPPRHARNESKHDDNWPGAGECPPPARGKINRRLYFRGVAGIFGMHGRERVWTSRTSSTQRFPWPP